MYKQRLRRLTAAALCGAVAFVLMYFSFSVPLLSPFAEFDLSAVPELIGGFILGPLGALEIITVKILLKLLFQGSSSMLTGEVQNFLLSASFVLPAVLIYRSRRSKKGAVLGIVAGAVISIITAVFTNIYLIFPVYIKLYDMDWEGIVALCSTANPWIRNVPTMIAFSIVPFNLISRAVTSCITILVYKKVSVPVKALIQ